MFRTLKRGRRSTRTGACAQPRYLPVSGFALALMLEGLAGGWVLRARSRPLQNSTPKCVVAAHCLACCS